MDVKQISDLIDILSRSDVSTLKYEEESFKLTLMKEKPAPQAVAVAQPAVQAVVQTPAPLPEVAGPPVAAEPSEPPAEDLAEMATPFVGTYYAAPSPDAEPFVKVGRRVTKGQIMCIVEAMKLMNEHRGDSRIIAGGTDLVLQSSRGQCDASIMIDITRIPGLDYIIGKDDFVVIGCLTTHADIVKSPIIREKAEILGLACESVGGPAARQRRPH